MYMRGMAATLGIVKGQPFTPDASTRTLLDKAARTATRIGHIVPAVPEGMCLGDPHQVIQAIKRWESIGVDQINFLLNSVEVLPQGQVLESLRLFARAVMPSFGPC